MRYQLDTNVCIRYLNGQSEPIRRQLLRRNPDEILLCSVVKAELLYGSMKSEKKDENLGKLRRFVNRFDSLPFDDQAAESYGRIRVQLEQEGTPVGPNDLMIAAIGIAHDAVLITHNTREFGRIEGLTIEDWE